MKKVSVKGIGIAYERRGKGTPMVLIHGYPLDRSIWNEAAPFLEKDFDLVIPDLRGFGESDVVESTYSVADLAADVAGLLDSLGIERALLAGHSMGGYVALAFNRAYAERVRGLAMISSQLGADAPDRKEGRYKTAAEVSDKGTAGVVEAMVPKLSPDGRVQSLVRSIMEHQKPLGVIGALKAMAERPDSVSMFSRLTIPVVVVHGDADALIPVERGREMKTALPPAHFAELAGLGHMTMMENSKALAEALKFFA